MMKINEKNVCAFATSATPVDKEGWLNKRGEVNKSFQKRWFVLKGNLLFYFDRRGDKEPVGVIILEGCTVEMAEDDEQYSFKIDFHGPNNRSYILGAESQESMEQWMKALACASYDYIKLLVSELQRQLDETDVYPEISSSKTLRSVPSPVPPPRRHNPFNRSAPPATNSSLAPKITFRELHNAYSRRILSDLNAWRHEKKYQAGSDSVNLISL